MFYHIFSLYIITLFTSVCNQSTRRTIPQIIPVSDKMFITITVIVYSLLISTESAITKEVTEIAKDEGDTFSLTCKFNFSLHHCEWIFNDESELALPTVRV